MSRQYWSEALAWVVADGTAVANTTAATIIFPDITIPANYMNDGRILTQRSWGKLSCTGVPTITFAIRWGGIGGTLLATTEAMTCGTTSSNVNWSIMTYIQTRSNGSTGSLLVFGEATIHTTVTSVSTNIFSVSGFDAPAAVTVNLTADTALTMSAQWSTALAADTLTGMLYVVRSDN